MRYFMFHTSENYFIRVRYKIQYFTDFTYFSFFAYVYNVNENQSCVKRCITLFFLNNFFIKNLEKILETFLPNIQYSTNREFFSEIK